MTSQLASDDRGPDSQAIRPIQLADKLSPTIKIFRVRRIVLNIVSSSSAEYAIGAELDDLRTAHPRNSRYQMGQKRIDRNCIDRVGDIFTLFDNPNAIEHDLRSRLPDRLLD